MAFITVKDMYKEKYSDKVDEKFPPKKADDNFSPSERIRMKELEEEEEEITQKPRPAGTGPKGKSRKK